MIRIQIYIFCSFFLILSNTSLCAQWQKTNGPHGGSITSIVADGARLFAGSYGGGALVSTDTAKTWKSINNGLDNKSISCFIKKDTSLFAGTYKGIFTSTDKGLNWNGVSSGIIDSTINCLTVNGKNILAGTSNGIYLTRNNALSWTRIDTNFLIRNVYSLAAQDSLIFAGTANNGIYLSSDFGKTWKLINNGLTNLQIYSIAIIDSNIFVGTFKGIFKSTNTGTTWTQINNGLPPNLFVTTLAVNGADIFAGSSFNGIYYSSDNGANWKGINKGLPTQDHISSIAFNENKIFIGFKILGGVFKSDNYGTTWKSASVGLQNINIRCMTSFGPNILTGSFQSPGIFLSVDSGNSWVSKNNGLWSTYILDLANHNNIVYAATEKGLFYSTDTGSNWIPINTDTGFYSVAVSGSLIMAGSINETVFLSSDAGLNWKKVKIKNGEGVVRSLLISGSDLFAGSWDGAGGIYYSDDNGITWHPRNQGLTNLVIEIVKYDGYNLYIGTQDGIFISSDKGINWSRSISGIPKDHYVMDFEIIGNKLFAATYRGGVYLSNDNGKNWSNMNSGSLLHSAFALEIVGDKLYAGSYGVWKRTISEMTFIEEILNINQEIKVYPNPTNGDVNIELSDVIFKNTKIQISNLLGEVIYKKSDSGKTQVLEMNKLESGIYILFISTDKGFFTKKIIKN